MLHRDPRLTALSRIIKAAGEKYRATGVKGNLRVPAITEAERIALAGLLERYVKTRPGETLTLGLKDLERALQEQAVSIDLRSAVAELTGQPLETRAERNAAQAMRWEAFLHGLATLGKGPRSEQWTGNLLRGESTVAGILRREFLAEEQTGHHTLLPDLAHVLAALDRLPADRECTTRLPVFAREITGNPHGFDDDHRAGRLLVRALTDLLGNACGVPDPPVNSLERGILLSSGGLLPDGISSTVAAFGLAGAVRRDGSPDRQAEGAALDGGVLIVSLRQVSEWQRLHMHSATLFAVENPAVFEALVDERMAGSAPPLLCTSGFLSVAAIRVLDLAVAQGLTIRYGGDFDLQGLTIAAGLARRYHGRLELWRMGPGDYRAAAAHQQVEELSESDLARLGEFAETPLAELAAAMQRDRRRAYQEALLGHLKQDYAGPIAAN